MTDYAAEQEMELEALEAILMGELSRLDTPPYSDWPETSTSYRIEVRSDEAPQEGTYEKKLDLVFAHTPNYPDEPPLYRLSNIQGLTEDDRKEVQRLLENQIEENLGMAMIYTIVSSLKEWLVDQNLQISNVTETNFELSEDEKLKREKEEEERKLAEARAHGIPVTSETFLDWKQKFETEKRLESAKIDPLSVDKDKGLTGKQFFLSQDTSGQAREDDEDGLEGTDFEEEEEDADDFYDEDDDDLDDDEENELLDKILAQKGQ